MEFWEDLERALQRASKALGEPFRSLPSLKGKLLQWSTDETERHNAQIQKTFEAGEDFKTFDLVARLDRIGAFQGEDHNSLVGLDRVWAFGILQQIVARWREGAEDPSAFEELDELLRDGILTRTGPSWNQRWEEVNQLNNEAYAAQRCESDPEVLKKLLAKARASNSFYPYFFKHQDTVVQILRKLGRVEEAHRIVRWVEALWPGWPDFTELLAGVEYQEWLAKGAEQPPGFPLGPATTAEVLHPLPTPSESTGPLSEAEIEALLSSRIGGDEWHRARNCALLGLLLSKAHAPDSQKVLSMAPSEIYLNVGYFTGGYLSTAQLIKLRHWLLYSSANHFGGSSLPSERLFFTRDHEPLSTEFMEGFLADIGGRLGIPGLSLRRLGLTAKKWAWHVPETRKLDCTSYAPANPRVKLPELLDLLECEAYEELDLSGVFEKEGTPQLAECKGLEHLKILDLSSNYLGGRALALAASPHLARLTHLRLRSSDLGPKEVAALATSPHLAQLEHLDLHYNAPGVRGMRALAKASFAPKIRSLRLSCCGLNEESMRPMLGAEFGALEELDLSVNDAFGDSAVSILCQWKLPQLTKLSLYSTGLSSEGAKALARCESLRQLKELNVGYNYDLGPEGVAALAGSPHLQGLEILHLGHTMAYSPSLAGCQALTQSRWKLQKLDLSVSGISTGELRVLCSWHGLRTLTQLNLSHNYFGNEGAKILLGCSHFDALEVLHFKENGMDDDYEQKFLKSPLFPALKALHWGKQEGRDDY